MNWVPKAFHFVAIALAFICGVAAHSEAVPPTWRGLALALTPVLGAYAYQGALRSQPPGSSSGSTGALKMLPLLLIAGLATSGCRTLQGQASLGAWKACEVGQLPAEGEGALIAVDHALGGASYQTELVALGGKIGMAQVDCAVQALVAYYQAQLPAHGEADPGAIARIERGQLWLHARSSASRGQSSLGRPSEYPKASRESVIGDAEFLGPVLQSHCPSVMSEHSLASPTWRRQSAFDSPSVGKPPRDELRMNAGLFGPFDLRHGLSAKGEQGIVSSVRGLLKLGRPSTVRRLVVSVDVDTINGVSTGWSKSHVCKKRLKTVEPSIADHDATSPVITESLCPAVGASVNEMNPCIVFWSGTSSVDHLGMPMSRCSSGSLLLGEASARITKSTPEIVEVHHFLRSAVASSTPSRCAQLGDQRPSSVAERFHAFLDHELKITTCLDVSRTENA